MTIKPAVFAILSVTLFLLHQPCLAQNGMVTSACSSVYENHNQVDYGPLKLEAVEGTSVIDVGGKVVQQGIVEACYGLFTENGHKLLVNIKADAQGNFRLKNIPPGHYRLVATLEGLCTANVPLMIVKGSLRPKPRLLIHFHPAGVDTCSYGEIDVKSGKT
jgi:hypothetical protein